MVILFGSYARGDYIDGPHTQGKGRLTIHKKSDYDILTIGARYDPDYHITKDQLQYPSNHAKKLHKLTEKPL